MIIIKPDRLRFSITWYMQRFFMLPLVWLVFRVFNRVEVEGLEHFAEVEGESVILAPNHVSAWDSWVGTSWALSSRGRYVQRDGYLGVLAAPENIPSWPLRILVSTLGGIPVDREKGVDQPGLRDVVRLMRDTSREVVLTLFPEGTRSKNGRLRRRGKPGLGWVQHQTGAVVVPIYHTGCDQMPCLRRRMKIRIGKPIHFDHYQGAPDDVHTWRAITGEVMDVLRVMEAEAYGESPPPTDDAPPPARKARRWRQRRTPSQRNEPAWV